ncbi:MAG: FkbM family methyltransferase [Opitutaceae bacterium]
MISPHYFTFPFYLPRTICELENWTTYLKNYLSRKQNPATYILRSGHQLIDATGTLAGTFAVVFIRREYGLIQRCRSIVDIGANMGTFTVYAARACPEARIVCYEPERKNFEYLSANLARNTNPELVTAFRSAVASSRGSRSMNTGESPLNTLIDLPDLQGRQLVSCTTLEEIFETNGFTSIDLMKINCEGAEYEIFETAPPNCVRQIRQIRLEYHNFEAKSGRTGRALGQKLESIGFRIERFSNYKDISGFIWATRI